jgi:nucleotide-binding universal stress UspA family protein
MYKRILVPIDGSPLAEQALPHAVALADCFQAELILLKVLTPLAETRNLPIGAVRKAQKITHCLANDYLDRITTEIQERDIHVRTVTIEGQPQVQIIRFAEEELVDLIVICTRGHSGFSRWLMGSVADRVTRGVSIPVLLVRAQKQGSS